MAQFNKKVSKNKKTVVATESAKKLIIDVFSVAATDNETQISLFVIDFLRIHDIAYTIDLYGNIIAKKGNADNVYVSHLDTVHEYPNGYNIVTSNRVITAYDNNKRQIGCGGDDKAGVAACLMLLTILDDVLCVFFSREEGGGVGSSNIDMSIFQDAKFIVGIDRWGNSDIVTNYMGDKTTSNAFNKAIKQVRKNYGYKHAEGMFTDVFNLFNRNVNVCCVNISCGYYSHHSAIETQDIDELFTAVLLCRDLSYLPQRYEYDKPYKPYKTYKTYNGAGYKSYGRLEEHCQKCGCLLVANEYQVCEQCTVSNNSCEYCGDWLISTWERDNNTCSVCADKMLCYF